MQSSVLGLPELIAHRGNAAEFPENTLEALASAVELGVRHVEFDVQLTADHVPVVFHDANLVRVAGRSECVHELDWQQLAGIPIGEPTRFGAQFAHVRPTSLAGLAEALPGWQGVTAFVEIKRHFDELFAIVAANNGAVVKTIGDEVMFVATTAADAAEIAVELVAFADQHPALRGLRGGLAWGRLVRGYGDYYGPVVNLAARAVKEAQPGEVLADLELIGQVQAATRLRVGCVPVNPANRPSSFSGSRASGNRRSSLRK